MQVTQVKAEGLARTFAVTIPKADIAARVDAKLLEIQPKVQIKGFRTGKVPASHIRKLYGQSIMSEVVEETVSTVTDETLKEQNLRPSQQPAIKLVSDAASLMRGEADLAYEFSVEIMPSFTPVDPRTISVVKPVVDIPDSEVDEQLEEIAKSARAYEPKKGKAATDDKVVIDFIGRIDGVAFEGGTADGVDLVLGSGRLIPGFEDQLVGVKAGEARDVVVTFPADYTVATLAGKEAVFAVTCKEVQAPQPVAIDDALATRVGLSDLATLRDVVKSNKARNLSGLARAVTKRRLFDILDEQHAFDLPTGMVSSEFDGIWGEVERERAQGQMASEDVGKTDEELRAEFRKIAERRVKLGLVLAEIGMQNKIDVTNEELQQALAREASRYPGQERQFIEMVRKQPGALMQIRAPIFEEKVVDYILELATVTTETLSEAELMAQTE